MGNDGGTNLSVVSQRSWCCGPCTFLPPDEELEMAFTCDAEEYRRGAIGSQSVEPQGQYIMSFLLCTTIEPQQLYSPDARHLMPIITPAYPSMCATHNITTSTKGIITKELDRADKICTEIFDGTRPWKDLFQRHTFFTEDYKYYLSIVSASQTKEAQQIWSGLVNSKVRRLVTGIEQSQAGVEIAHPYVKSFDRIHKCKNEEEKDKTLQGSLEFQAKDTETETTDQANSIKQSVAASGSADNMEMPAANGEKQEDGVTTVYTTTFYVGIQLAKEAKSLDISWPVAEFKRQCTEWAQYNENLNSIRCVHLRKYVYILVSRGIELTSDSYNLPEDVFEAGETRPTKSKKSKAATSKKRSLDDANLDVRIGVLKCRGLVN